MGSAPRFKNAEGYRILIVEDESKNREMLNRIITREGFVTATAEDGQAGLEAYTAFRPDIIITDLKMPVMSGLEMTRRIREEDKRVHIIAFTAYNELDFLHEALEAGINHYLVKPFDGELFFSVLARTLQEIEKREAGESRIRLLTHTVDQRESQLERIIESAQLGTWEWDFNSQQFSYNALFATLHDIPPHQKMSRLSQIFLNGHRQDRKRLLLKLREIATRQTSGKFTLQYRIRHGAAYRWIETVGDITRFSDDRHAIQISGISYDIDERKRNELKLLQTAKIFTSTRDAISITDASKRIIDINKAFEEITGYTKEDVLGKTHAVLKSGQVPKEVYGAMHRSLEKKGIWQGDVVNRKKNGELFPAWLTASTVTDLNGNITNYVAVFSDITKIKEQQSRVEYLASHDPLTGLANRTMLMSLLEHSLRQAARRDRKVALLFVDLDGFKYINDTFGHNVGDGILVEFASRLRETLRKEDFICRLGGDEFLILLDNQDTLEYLDFITRKVLQIFDTPFFIDLQEFRMTASIGISIFPDDAGDPDTIIRHSDIAMYKAKNRGKNTFEIYSSPMGDEVSRHLQMQNELQQAIERDAFELHYQPQIDLSTNCVTGLECLVRWQHDQQGLIPPDEFIPLAEETRQIIPLGITIFRRAALFVKSLIDAGHFEGHLAINISTVQLEEGERFLETIRTLLEKTGFDPHRLEVEITETFVMKNPHRSYAILEEIHAMGITIALDDFGTGYSSLNQLNKYPIDLIKIDKSFIDEIPEKEDDTVVTKTIIALAKNLKIPVLAEGVETEAQQEFLQREGCDFGQGYLISRPLNETALQHYLETLPKA